jgi:hypothetical protein
MGVCPSIPGRALFELGLQGQEPARRRLDADEPRVRRKSGKRFHLDRLTVEK